MSLTTKVADLATRIGTEIKAVRNSIGSLSSLDSNFNDTSSIVAALNDSLSISSSRLGWHSSQTTDVHGIADTSALETKTGAQAKADAAAAAAEAFATSAIDALSTSDIEEGSRLYFTPARAQAALAGLYDAAGSASAAQTAAELYADGKIAALVDGAPGLLDTLNELAAAIGDDANFVSTVTTALNARVRFDAAQSLTSGQKTTARDNIGAAAAADLGDVSAADFVATFEAALV